MNKGQLIFYNEEDFNCYHIDILEVKQEEQPIIDDYRSFDSTVHKVVGIPSLPTFEFTCGREPIELDPTTMKKIARYNKEVEIERLDKMIEGKKAELEGLTKKYDFQLKKLKNAKAFIKEFLGQSEYADPYDYVKGDYDDENDYDYDYDDEED